jgi:hypothetical protein
MYRNRNLSKLFFSFTLGATFALANVSLPDLHAQSPETASYQNLQPDQFMTKWLVLGPLPVFEGKPNPEDQDTQK